MSYDRTCYAIFVQCMRKKRMVSTNTVYIYIYATDKRIEKTIKMSMRFSIVTENHSNFRQNTIVKENL